MRYDEMVLNVAPTNLILESALNKCQKKYPQKIPLHYQDPRGFAKTIFLDSLNACKDMQMQVPDFGEGTFCSWLKL
jgi:hypothetical protein